MANQDDLYEDSRDPAPPEAAPVVAPTPSTDPDVGEGMASLLKKFGPPGTAVRHAPAPRREPAVAPAPSAAPPTAGTHFAAAAQEAPELSWGDTMRGAVANAVPSTGGLVKSTWDAITHPKATVGALSDLATGAVSQAKGALGVQQDPVEKAKDEQLINALEDHYKHVYGSIKGFKQALATDPASIAMDATTLLGGAGAVAKGAGLASTAGALTKTASAVDPIQNALRVAGKVSPIITKPLRFVGSSSGVSPYLQKVATAAGATTDAAKRAAYELFASGKGDAADYLQTAQNAVSKARNAASQDYLATKGSIAGNQIDLSDALQKVTALEQGLQKGAGSGWGEAKKAAVEARSMVEDVMTHPDPAKRSLDEVDALKQQLWDLHDQYRGNSKAQSHISGVYHAVRDALGDPAVGGDAGYAKLMDSYQNARLQLQNQTKTLGTAGNANATASLMKGIKASKTGAGQSMLEEMAKYEPTLPYMLAGHASNPLARSWTAAAADAAGGAFTASLFGLHPLAGLPLAIASSPRVVAGLNKAAGTVSRGASKIPMKSGIYAGRAEQTANPQPTPQIQPAAEAPFDTHRPLKPMPGYEPDVDAATRMAIGEAGGERDDGKAAVVHTAINRSKASGVPLSDVIAQPNAYESVTNGRAAKISPDDPEYKRVRDEIVRPALAGQIPDPTGGATHFINHDLQTALGRQTPSWATGEPRAMIGHHTFYSPDERAAGGRVGRASGGRIDSAQHERLVGRLMKLARSAKKASDKVTEPLLQQPDERIVKALDVAQKAI